MSHEPSPPLDNRTSMDVPRHFASLRHSHDEQSARREVARQSPKLEKKANAVTITEHLKTVQQLSAWKSSSRDYTLSRINPSNPKASLGLSSESATQLLSRHGPNRLTPPRKLPMIFKLFKELLGLFNLLLTLAGVLCFITFISDLITSQISDSQLSLENLFLAVMLVFVSVFSAFFSYAQESKSGKVMEGFKNLVPTKAMVIRNGEQVSIDANLLVPGDIVIISGGSKVPADVRCLATDDCKVDNSSITGEAEPQKRLSSVGHENPLETNCVMFFGSFCTQGRCVGLVIATGNSTVVGTIAKLAGKTSGEATPLHKNIQSFIYKIAAFALAVGFVFICVGFALGYGVVQTFVFAIAIIVANVPQGFLPTVTLALTLTSQRMAKRNVLVKNLETVEILGSCSVICSDKTGTLTQNRMTVSNIYVDRTTFKCATNPSESHQFNVDDPAVIALYQVATLCNTARFASDPQTTKDVVTIGDASESALIKWAQSIKDIDSYRKEHPIIGAIPFNSKNKWQLHVHFMPELNKYVLFMKGAPERIIKMCTHILLDGQDVPLSERYVKQVESSILNLGQRGERVLGFARLIISDESEMSSYMKDDNTLDMDRLSSEEKLPRYDLTFVGLTGLIDPPREGVKEAVKSCFDASIRVVMVTGDHRVTATAIARQVGIVEGRSRDEIAEEKGILPSQVPDDEYNAVVVTGDEIDRGISDEQWDIILSKKYLVFARTSPHQKRIIVKKFQKRGEIVAVTGDGVNDSPALKKANIGISMGLTGTDVAKEAADMILLDDNFASIVNGIEEGRLIFDNLKKSIAYTLTHITPELVQFVTFVVLGFPLPLGTIMILCIDLGTEMIPGLAFAQEKAEASIMSRPPRNQSDPLVSLQLMSWAYLIIGMTEFVGCMYAYFCVMAYYGFPPNMLFGLARESFSVTSSSKPVVNMFGEWIGPTRQVEILSEAQTAYFLGIVVQQLLINSFNCKSRTISIADSGLLNNRLLLFGIFSSIALSVTLIYIPVINSVFGFSPVAFKFWFPTVIFGVLTFVFNECRKYIMRNNSNSWIYKFTLW